MERNIEELPDHFDARKEWPMCPTIGHIRNQGKCRGCWAFAAAEAMSDRICITTNGKLIVELAALDLISCCRRCGGYAYENNLKYVLS